MDDDNRTHIDLNQGIRYADLIGEVTQAILQGYNVRQALDGTFEGFECTAEEEARLEAVFKNADAVALRHELLAL